MEKRPFVGMICSARDFVVYRENIPLFAPISFALNRGELLTLQGPNGIGKTSLLESICHLQCYTGSLKRPEHVLYVGTQHPFEPEETVRQNMHFWRFLLNPSLHQFRATLKQWGLLPLLEIPFKSLSLGQRQRLNLALISFSNADLWLLDEPFTGLDEEGGQILGDLLEGFLIRGGTVILASHTLLKSHKVLALEAPQGPSSFKGFV